MAEPFGRKKFGLAAAAPTRAVAPPAPRAARRRPDDPELESWKAARAKGLWLRLLTPWVLVLGGPMSFLMPEGIGQALGIGASLIGGLALWRRRSAREV